MRFAQALADCAVDGDITGGKVRIEKWKNNGARADALTSGGKNVAAHRVERVMLLGVEGIKGREEV